jgi:hypothetical protein
MLGNAACSPSGTCRCVRAHFASATGDKCIPGNINVTDNNFTSHSTHMTQTIMLPELGESCQEGSHGDFIKESFCRKGRWSCRSKVASKDNRECLKGDFTLSGYLERSYISLL